jgi:hypothetical protein
MTKPIHFLKVKFSITRCINLAALVIIAIAASLCARAGVPAEKDLGAYLLVYFLDKDHSLHFALSSDGYSFTDVNHGQPVMKGEELAEQKVFAIRTSFAVRIMHFTSR